MCLHVCVCVVPQGEDGEGDRGEPAPVTTQPSAAAAAPSTGDPEKDKKIRNIKKVAVCVFFCFLSIHTHCVSVCVYWVGGGEMFYDEFVYVNIVYFDVSCFYLGYGMSVLRAYLRKGALRPHHYYYSHLPLFWSIKWLWICLKSYLPHVGSQSLCASYCLQPECWG